MSARLSTAIRIGEAARAILRKTQSFPDHDLEEQRDPGERLHVGVEPMLLALSMELALKAWFVFDYDDPRITKSHNLVKLFDRLKPDSQRKLDSEFKGMVAPNHPSAFLVNNDLRRMLYQHQDAFIDWRYLHEAKSMMFDRSIFEAALEMILAEFEKRYRIEPAGSH